MATVVNRSQQVVTPAIAPKAAYSRNLGFCFMLEPGAPTERFDRTESCAQDLWLLRCQLWFKLADMTTEALFDWKIVTCTEDPAPVVASSIINVRDVFEEVVVLRNGPNRYGEFWGNEKHFDYSMRRRYTGIGRRFVVWVRVTSAVNLYVKAMFEISEG